MSKSNRIICGLCVSALAIVVASTLRACWYADDEFNHTVRKNLKELLTD